MKDVVATLALQRNPVPDDTRDCALSGMEFWNHAGAAFQREERYVTSLLPVATMKKCYEILSAASGQENPDNSRALRAVNASFVGGDILRITHYLLVHMTAVHT